MTWAFYLCTWQQWEKGVVSNWSQFCFSWLNPIQSGVFWNHIGWEGVGDIVPPLFLLYLWSNYNQTWRDCTLRQNLSKALKSLLISSLQGNAGINLTGYHPPGNPRLLHQNVCSAPGLLHNRKCPSVEPINDDPYQNSKLGSILRVSEKYTSTILSSISVQMKYTPILLWKRSINRV